MNNTKRWRVAQYFEIRWWKAYLKDKDVDSYLENRRKYWYRLLQQMQATVQPVEGVKILDAGCGPAGIFIVFDKHDVTAIDPLLDQYQAGLVHFSPTMYPNVKFETIALEQFDAQEQYDLVFCINAINHVSDLHEAFLRLYNSAKKGSKLVVSIDAHNHQFFKHLFRLQPGDVLHPHQYDLREYEQMLNHLNCSVLQTLLVKREFFFNHYLIVAQKN
jgi:2-polyprenyl-3-methyl-5-hydroxy-6-metoxy-1,4-benzoquinol methylase